MSSSLIDKIKNRAKAIHSEIVEIRRHLHANPELSFFEKETSDYISKKLTEYGIQHQKNIGGYGIVALINPEKASKFVVALRGDMDALPIQEENDVSYKSTKSGVMHACGHDVHSSCLLGVAKILNEIKDELNGTVKLIFQPAEEKLPGGATLMIADGVLENPRPNFIIGQHVMPFIETGKVGFRKGMYMASSDEIEIKVIGKGGHGAMPHLCIDPIAISAQIITSLQQLISRVSMPIQPSVLTIGRIEGLGTYNVIPNEVTMLGTFRTLNEEWRTKAHIKIQEICENIAQSFGAIAEVKINKGYPHLFNNVELTTDLEQNAKQYLGSEKVEELTIWMAAEDFAYYSHEIDACFYRLGTGNFALGTTNSVHTPKFNIDEDAIITGVGLMAYLTASKLS